MFQKLLFEYYSSYIITVLHNTTVKPLIRPTPIYVEINNHNDEVGYHMGVYLCLGQHSHGLTHGESLPFSNFENFETIQNYVKENSKIYVFLGDSKHKIKKKAEQQACKIAITQINK